MYCPRCKSLKIPVRDTRPSTSGNGTKRWRRCLDCENRFTSYELLWDDVRAVFDHEDILAGMRELLQKMPLRSRQMQDDAPPTDKEPQDVHSRNRKRKRR